jgi:acyl-CoA synthetase (NDP forming)
MGGADAPAALAAFPGFTFPESAATALSRVTAYARWRSLSPGEPCRLSDLQIENARRVVSGVLERGGGWARPDEVQALLGAIDVPTARAATVTSAAAAADAARALGFPVALKAVGETLIHKSDVGGVKLGLRDEAAVRAACEDLTARLRPSVEGILVQEMVEGGVEVMVGALQDPTFGPLVVYGSGGILVELLHDAAFRLAPLAEAEAEEMLKAVQGSALLRGYRGGAPVDERALLAVILRISGLIAGCPEIQELDLNPVRVRSQGAIALDARVRIARPVPPARTRRISY